MPEQWLPVLMQAVLALVIACALVALSFLIGRKVKNPVKDMPYECGIVPTGDARERFSLGAIVGEYEKFYEYALSLPSTTQRSERETTTPSTT